ncbi:MULTISPECIES: hypothetical protein [Parafrankia]|uniref:Uncharacterized protein n=1 Tax=Parafrankia soli TaxID=2599596 RepID=A0A1S1PUQ6_9ACTN|nr:MULTISPECIES: hypothetical protein [Parafrankia]OHV24675.1 hypothetical protein BBK14_23145 [Parafrankia soli]TCJ32612.1 hypothetical protein E0504_41580 [Parafrankia sp. BMG5.11]CAI7976486.1 hypothetical protein FRAHR75_250069 [Frankia sp. Hr75.2]SQD98052.1 hypothetical protein FMEAI12_4470021 [Parafrankia sp. Ea1.12]
MISHAGDDHPDPYDQFWFDGKDEQAGFALSRHPDRNHEKVAFIHARADFSLDAGRSFFGCRREL